MYSGEESRFTCALDCTVRQWKHLNAAPETTTQVLSLLNFQIGRGVSLYLSSRAPAGDRARQMPPD